MLQSDLEYSSCYNISVGTVCSKSLVYSEYDMKIGLDVLGMHIAYAYASSVNKHNASISTL